MGSVDQALPARAASIENPASYSGALPALLRADPVGHLLLVRLRLHFVFVAATALGLLLVTLIFLPRLFPAAAQASAQHPKVFLGTTSGAMMIVSWFIFVPVVWGFYAWQPLAIARLHRRLDECLGKTEVNSASSQLYDWYHRPVWTAIAATLALWEFYRFMSPEHEFVNAGPWVFDSTIAIRAAFVLLASLTYYMVALLVIRQFIATISINRIFERESVPCRFLHPDQCGGFGFLGEHALGIAPLIAAAGLTISLVYVRMITGGPLGSDTAVYSLILVSMLYVGGSIMFFVAPLWSAHKEMLSARDAWLADIAQGFELQQEVVRNQMRGGNPDADSVAKLETARKAWDIGRSLPTWPLNVAAVRKFTAALASPLIPIGIAALQQMLRIK
jgi:hypothetical protein